MGKTNDRRSLRTKKALKAAMLEQLRGKDIAKITVSELSELADIGRGTFYLHFTDPYDLLDKLENEILEEITAHTSTLMDAYTNENLLTHLESIWQNIYENMGTLEVLLNRRNGGRFMEKIKRYCVNSTFDNAQGKFHSAQESYGVIYIISGTLGIFQEWMEQGAPIPPNQLAQIVRNLITGPP